MTRRLNRKLTVLLTTIALGALPADALASGNPGTTHHHRHGHHASVRYVLGDNWNTPDHRRSRRLTGAHRLELIVSRSI